MKAMMTFLIGALLIVAIVLSGLFLPIGMNWLAVIILMMGLYILLGKKIVGRAAGILINERKLMSLSRFQMALWTLIVLSAFFTIAMARINLGTVAEPLAIKIEWQTWALIGVSATAMVGTPMIYSNKKKKEPADKDQALKKAAGRTGREEVDTNREGILFGNAKIDDAAWTDMFEGDELGNAPYIDLTKVQMFLFTVIVAIAYCTELMDMILHADLAADVLTLPTVSEGLLALMGISNAGYLANKGVDHTPSEKG